VGGTAAVKEDAFDGIRDLIEEAHASRRVSSIAELRRILDDCGLEYQRVYDRQMREYEERMKLAALAFLFFGMLTGLIR
jgi:hypothetical protein